MLDASLGFGTHLTHSCFGAFDFSILDFGALFYVTSSLVSDIDVKLTESFQAYRDYYIEREGIL